MRIIPFLLIFVIAVVFLSGCVGQPQQTGGDNTPPQPNTIVIKNFAFDPPSITIKKGTTVTWKNEDSTPHQVASDPHPTHTDLPGLESEMLSQGQSYSFTFNKTGTFGYHCHLHPSMKGTVIVEE